MNSELLDLAQRIGSALFNGVYQGALVVLVVWLAFRFIRKLSATTRHAIGFIALLVVGILPVLHFANSFSRSAQPADAAVNLKANDSALESETVASSSLWNFDSMNLAEDLEVPAAVPRVGETEVSDQPTIGSEIVAEPVSESRWAGFSSLIERVTPHALFREIPPMAIVSVVGGVMVIVFWRLLRLLTQSVSLWRLKAQGEDVDQPTKNIFDQTMEETGCRRRVRLMCSKRINTPIAIGYFRPVVMLPQYVIAASEAQALQSIFRHEIAHVSRYDDWFNLLQQIVVAICFYNPAVWWLSRQLSLDRELACDDHALNRLESPEEYALTLAEFAGRSQESRWIAAPAAWNSKNQLKERINMILDPNRNTSLKIGKTSAGILAIVAVSIAGVAFLAAPRLVLAQSATRIASNEPAVSSDQFVTQSSADLPSAENSSLFGGTSKTSGQPSGGGDVFGDPAADNSVSKVDVFANSSGDEFVVSTPRVTKRTVVRTRNSQGNGDLVEVRSYPKKRESPYVIADAVPVPEIVVSQNPSSIATPLKPTKPTRAVAPVDPVLPSASTYSAPKNSSLEKRMEKLERQIAELTKTPNRRSRNSGLASEENYSTERKWESWEANPTAGFGVSQGQQSGGFDSASGYQTQMQMKKSRNVGSMENQRKDLETRKRALENKMRELERQMERVHAEVHAVEAQLERVSGYESPKTYPENKPHSR